MQLKRQPSSFCFKFDSSNKKKECMEMFLPEYIKKHSAGIRG